MEALLKSYGSWWQLLLLVAFLLGLYFSLQFLQRMLVIVGLKPSTRRPLENLLRMSLIAVEPLGLLLILLALLRINPLLHGSIVVLALIGAFPHVRNYLSGRLVKLEDTLHVGEAVAFNGARGQIVRLGRLGMKVRQAGGLQHIGYHRLLTEGYVRESGSETGEFYRLKLAFEETKEQGEKEKRTNHRDTLTQLFGTAPFIDWAYLPELTDLGNTGHEWLARVQVREEKHLNDLIRLLKERGYTCETIANQGN